MIPDIQDALLLAANTKEGQVTVKTRIIERVAGVSFIVAMLLAACGKSTLHISGDSRSVGAEIFIDGRKVGVMEKRVYEGSTSKDPVVVEREKKLMQDLAIKPGDVRAGAMIKIAAGEYELKLLSVEGKELTKRFKIRGENYLIVSFERMIIEGK